MTTNHKPATALPTFAEIAAQRLQEAGSRDRTISVKVAINTAHMMVAQEIKRNLAYPRLVAALNMLEACSCAYEHTGNGNMDDATRDARALLAELGEA